MKIAIKLKIYYFFILFACMMAACGRQSAPVNGPSADDSDTSAPFDLDQIQQSGELIALTVAGPQTYFDYHGSVLGVHYMLCQQFADSIGVRLRMELCRDTTDMMRRFRRGDADVVAYPMTQHTDDSPGWLVSAGKPMLTSELHRWYSAGRYHAVTEQEQHLLSAAGRVKRKVYVAMLNREAGVISRYDALFQHYAQRIHWDWRLLAAQCYQESTFDPQALSWAGARGLMQIMPSTADHLGLSRADMYNPEQNIEAAVRYIAELDHTFNDVKERRERQNFVLAAYNGGTHHVRDAMALARRDGANSYSWTAVAPYVLRLSDPRYYEDPIVKYGYMRGSETVDYVHSIRERYQQYRGVKAVIPSFVPQRSRSPKHRQKYDV